MNDHSPIPVTENDYNQYFQALKNLESVAFFGVYGIKKNALGNLERANSSQTPGFLSFLMQLIQSLWSKKVVETNRRTTEQITTSDDLNRDVDLVTAMNQRIKGIADKELSRDSKWHLREENYYGWQVMRLYNSRLVSIQAWNEYVEPQSIYSKIRVALEKALGYYVSSLKSIGDGTPLTTTTQFKADSEKTNRFFKITEKMHQDRISGKLDIHRATHVLQLMGGVFLRKDMIDTTARLANPAASHQLGNIGRVLYLSPIHI